LPDFIHVIAPIERCLDDLIAAADVGLVDTTTVGLEMAIAEYRGGGGVYHYRGRGFFKDPDLWLNFTKCCKTSWKNRKISA
jgi:hypothetical protein